MIRTRHKELRAAMVQAGFDGKRLADNIGISNVTLSSRMCGHTPWTSKEMYQIMDLLDLPHWDLNKYFPKDGISNPNCYCKLETDLPPSPPRAIRLV